MAKSTLRTSSAAAHSSRTHIPAPWVRSRGLSVFLARLLFGVTWSTAPCRSLIAAATAALGIATALLLLIRRYLLARIAVAGTVGGIFVAWGAAQYPFLVPPDLTIANASSPPSVMGPLLISTTAGMVVLLPSLWLLLYLFKARNRPQPHPSAEDYLEHLPPSPDEIAARERAAYKASIATRATHEQQRLVQRHLLHLAEELGLAVIITVVRDAVSAWRDRLVVRAAMDEQERQDLKQT